MNLIQELNISEKEIDYISMMIDKPKVTFAPNVRENAILGIPNLHGKYLPFSQAEIQAAGLSINTSIKYLGGLSTCLKDDGKIIGIQQAMEYQASQKQKEKIYESYYKDILILTYLAQSGLNSEQVCKVLDVLALLYSEVGCFILPTHFFQELSFPISFLLNTAPNLGRWIIYSLED